MDAEGEAWSVGQIGGQVVSPPVRKDAGVANPAHYSLRRTRYSPFHWNLHRAVSMS